MYIRDRMELRVLWHSLALGIAHLDSQEAYWKQAAAVAEQRRLQTERRIDDKSHLSIESQIFSADGNG